MKNKFLILLFLGCIQQLFALQISTGVVSLFEDPQFPYQMKIDINTDISLVTITMRAPANRWYGLAFGAIQMADQPYAIIANSTTGDGTVMERKLGDHNAGSLLSNTLTIVSDVTVSSIRELVITRPIVAGIYNFPTTPSSINILWALGMSKTFGFHLYRSPTTITFYTDCASITGTTPGGSCGPGKVALGAAASGGTLRWYSATIGGPSLGTGNLYTTPSLSTSTTYYVSTSSGSGCISERIPVLASVFSLPAITITASKDTVCVNTVVTLTASGATTYLWSTGIVGNVLTFMAKSDVLYFVKGTDTNGCSSTTNKEIYVKSQPADVTKDGLVSAVDLNQVLLHLGNLCK